MTVLAAYPGTRAYAGGQVLVGPGRRRVLRLTPDGALLAARLLAGEAVDGPAAAALARRLVGAGLARALVAGPGSVPPYEVVVPGYGEWVPRVFSVPAVVVDDGSPLPIDGAALRHERNRGPAAARNTGLRATTAEFVGFVDSDASIDPDSLDALAAVIAGDPRIGAVAPRIRPAAASPRTVLGRFADAFSPLDMGPRSGPVGPGFPVPYVPSTVLVVRRAAIEEVGGFDERLRVGEDVDLVRRLVAAGWSVHYAADVEAQHDEPTTWSRWLVRRARYGTSAGPLAGSTTAHPTVAGLRRLPPPVATRIALEQTVGLSRSLTQTWWPLLVVGLARRRLRRLCVAAVVTPVAVEYERRRPRLDPLRWFAAMLADDVAYGVGVWVGSVRARTMRPLVPVTRARTPRPRDPAHRPHPPAGSGRRL